MTAGHWALVLEETVLRARTIAHPENRGTATGILLPLLHLEWRQPDAIVVVLPSDHFVADEKILGGSLMEACAAAAARPAEVYLLAHSSERVFAISCNRSQLRR